MFQNFPKLSVCTIVEKGHACYSMNDSVVELQACLFDDRAHTEFRKVLEHVRKGCRSDPEGDEYPFYTAVGEDGHGPMLYRCHRGINSCEASHNVLKRKFGTMNAGVALTHCLMLWHIQAKVGNAQEPESRLRRILLRECLCAVCATASSSASMRHLRSWSRTSFSGRCGWPRRS